MDIRAHHLRIFWQMFRNSDWFNRKLYDSFPLPPVSSPKPKVMETVTNMYVHLINEPDSEVIIIDSLDDICIACGTHDGIKCTKYDNLRRADDETLADYELQYRKKYKAKKIAQKLLSLPHF
jgi:hypothetical protein